MSAHVGAGCGEAAVLGNVDQEQTCTLLLSPLAPAVVVF